MLGGVDAGLLVRRQAGGLLGSEPKKARGARELAPFVVSVASKDHDSPVVRGRDHAPVSRARVAGAG
jgi:hypothetical protein